MTSEKIFPILMIALQFGASIIYFCKQDVRHGTYWLSAAVITVTVTF
jgi:hypothetical protein